MKEWLWPIEAGRVSANQRAIADGAFSELAIGRGWKDGNDERRTKRAETFRCRRLVVSMVFRTSPTANLSRLAPRLEAGSLHVK